MSHSWGGLPDVLFGRPWSAMIPGRVFRRLERHSADLLYSRLPAPELAFRHDVPRATLLFAGDLAMHRWTEEQQQTKAFGHVREVFRSADLRVLNLEAVLTLHDRPAGKIGTFLRARPEAVSCLQYLGVDAVTLANNHALDYGERGLGETADLLARCGIDPIGLAHGSETDPCPGAVVKRVNGLRIGLLAMTDHFGGVPPETGIRPVWLDQAHLENGVRLLRGQCDIVVVQLHWGYEYSMYPLFWHRNLARRLVEAGADIVCCHHAHVIMGVERWERGVIAHGLGNFYFGLPGHRHPLGHHGLLLRAQVDAQGLIEAGVIPIHTTPAGHLQADSRTCPGFDRLCLRLDNDELLKAVQDSHLAQEVARLTLDITERLAAGDDGGLVERQAFFRAPRQQWLLATTEATPQTDLREAGGWLLRFQEIGGGHPTTLRPPSPQLRRRLHRHLDVRRARGRLP